MNYIKFLESKTGKFLGKSHLVRVLIWKLFIGQCKRRKRVALVPECIMQEYGEKEVHKMIQNHIGNDDLIVGSPKIVFFYPQIKL